MNTSSRRFSSLIGGAIAEGIEEAEQDGDFARHRTEVSATKSEMISKLGAAGAEVCAGLQEIEDRNPSLKVIIIQSSGIDARISEGDSAICDVNYTVGGMFASYFIRNHISGVTTEVSGEAPETSENVIKEAARAVGNHWASKKAAAAPVVA